MTTPFGGPRTAPGLPNLPTPPTGWPVGSYATYEEAQRAVDHLFSFGGFRGEEEENPIHLAKKFRRLAGFSDDEITELVDVAAQAFAEAQARSAAAAGEPAAAAS